MPFIDQIIDACAGSKVFSFIYGFSGYNQIQIKPEDQHKTAFIFPWGTFAYKKIPFGLKNVKATFQWETTVVVQAKERAFTYSWMLILITPVAWMEPVDYQCMDVKAVKVCNCT